MNRIELEKQIAEKRSCLCVGLDSDFRKLPVHFPSNAKGVLEFNKEIISATRDLCVAYKLNTAFYEVMGAEGWTVMHETIKAIGPDHLIIADAKRGDIGNTAEQYAKTFFDHLQADAITLSPYMGGDTLEAFVSYTNKWSIVLALTSNPGARDLQWLPTNGQFVYQHVINLVKKLGTPDNSMFVVGGTRPEDLEAMRADCPEHFFLVPGVGKQGGTVSSVMKAGKINSKSCGLLINSSRSIIFASSKRDFAEAARASAKDMTTQMAEFIS